MDIVALAREIEPGVIKLRRHFHQYPERSMKEFNTIAFIVDYLERLGIVCEIVPDGGVIGILEGANHGKTIILRSDVDALPITESPHNLNQERCVISTTEEAAHLCGHDAHMAMLLGSARILSKMRASIKGRIIFAFEQGEETGGGIYNLLNRLVEIGADGVWGIHVKSDLPVGKISVEPGPRMASIFPFHVEIKGKGGHGSRPDLAASPLDCFHHFYQQLQTLRLHSLNPFQPITFSIGSVHAGAKRNAYVIPETLQFSGTARYLHMEQGREMEQQFNALLDHVSAQYQCSYRPLQKTKPIDMPVYNQKDCAMIAEKAIAKTLGSETITSHPAWMASEPFAFYQKYFPGVFAFVGIENEEKGSGAEHHNAHFDIDEDALYLGVVATVQYTLDFLNYHGKLAFKPETRSVSSLFEEVGF